MKVLVCKHSDDNGLGCFAELFQNRGIRVDYQELNKDAGIRSLKEYQGLILMGGAMGVHDIAEYPFLKLDYTYIAEALAIEIPILGFCLGGQIIAHALGAEVRRNPRPELGWYEVELTGSGNEGILRGFPGRFHVFQWHQDTFAIPTGAIRLASSIDCTNQAFAWKKRVFGLQFHLEMTGEIVEEWLRDTEAVRAWGFDPVEIQKITPVYIEQSKALAALLFENFYRVMLSRTDSKGTLAVDSR